MRSNSPFRQDSCAEQKEKMKAQYKKDGKEKEYSSKAEQTEEATKRGISTGKPLPSAKPKN
jgi:hypothetical protein